MINAASLVYHLFNHTLNAVKRSFKVDVYNFIPLLLGHFYN